MGGNVILSQAATAARVIESLDNLVITNITPRDVKEYQSAERKFRHDSDFWNFILSKKTASEVFPLVSIEKFTISEWIPRIPGLFYSKKVERIRMQIGIGALDHLPSVKTKFVLGGVGTSSFAPNFNGQRILCLTSTNNANTGIPIIIPNNLWHDLSLKSGQIVSLSQVKWEIMAEDWARRFESTNNIPRGMLRVEDKSQIKIIFDGVPPMFTPFSILEHIHAGALHYDYVFCMADSFDTWDEIADYFEKYRKKNGNAGRFLIKSNSEMPYFEAEYESPDHLKMAEVGGRYHLAILKDNIRNTYFRNVTFDEILSVLSIVYNSVDDIKRLGGYLNFPLVQLLNSNAADCIAQLLVWCKNNDNKMEELLDILSLDHPLLFTFKPINVNEFD